MDRYAFILEGLRQRDFERLRTFVADGRGRFTTWLVVVSRRLCEDFRRRTYGRPQGSSSAAEASAALRWRLVDPVAEGLDPDLIADPGPLGPEMEVRLAERRDALAEALSGLSAEDRLMLQLRFEQDLSAREVAELLGIPTAFHVYRRVRKLLKPLRITLRSLGVRDPSP
jgi:RNA polymerase sigma factor (sigma-70 family)